MKKCIALALCLALLLTGCGGGGALGGLNKQPEGDPFTPYYDDYAVRSMRATVFPYTDKMGAMGAVNNLYKNQAKALFDALETATYRESELDVPEDGGYLQVSFRPHSDTAAEVYTVYENNLVTVAHPATDTVTYAAAGGLFERLLSHLKAVRKAQQAYFAVSSEEIKGDKHYQAGYRLFTPSGKVAVRKNTGQTMADVDLCGEGVVRVKVGGSTFFYDQKTGRQTAAYRGKADLAGKRLVVADGTAVKIYNLFDKNPKTAVYVTGGVKQPVVGVSLSAAGDSLHLYCRDGQDSYFDRTLNVTDLLKNRQKRYLLGNWQGEQNSFTEAQEQNIGYKTLKRIRHRERKMGQSFSTTLEGRFDLGGKIYYLVRVGHWKDIKNPVPENYVTVIYLMVPADVSAGYEATLSENEVTWNTGKNWFN